MIGGEWTAAGLYEKCALERVALRAQVAALEKDRDALAAALQQLVDETTDALLSTFGDSAASPLENEPAIKNARDVLAKHGGKP